MLASILYPGKPWLGSRMLPAYATVCRHMPWNLVLNIHQIILPATVFLVCVWSAVVTSRVLSHVDLVISRQRVQCPVCRSIPRGPLARRGSVMGYSTGCTHSRETQGI